MRQGIADRVRELAPVQIFGFLVGGTYIVVGLAGFVVTGFDDFAAAQFDERLTGLPINPLHNLVHLLGGIVAVVASATGVRVAKRAAVGFAILFFIGFVLGVTGNAQNVAIEGAASPDNYLHLVTGLLALYFGTIGAGRPGDLRRT